MGDGCLKNTLGASFPIVPYRRLSSTPGLCQSVFWTVTFRTSPFLKEKPITIFPCFSPEGLMKTPTLAIITDSAACPTGHRTLNQSIGKIDIKDRNLQSDKNCNLFDGHVDWAEVRAALKQIRFNGWATAEVGGGDAARMKQVADRMDRVLGL